MRNEIKEYTNKIFEDNKHIDDDVQDYYLARELMPLLEYSKWERFTNEIKNAQLACITLMNIFSRSGKW